MHLPAVLELVVQLPALQRISVAAAVLLGTAAQVVGRV
jgi:hypothetical protein